MDRVHYRRVSPSRINGEPTAAAESEDLSAVETVILQSIVCGVLLIVVLIIGMLNFAPMTALRDELRHVLTGAETPHELITEMQNFSETYLGVTPQEIIPTAEDEILNPQIPVPSAVPGLWE